MTSLRFCDSARPRLDDDLAIDTVSERVNVALIIYYRYLYTINSYTYSGIDQLKVPQLKYTAPNLIEETKVTNLERSMEKLAKTNVSTSGPTSSGTVKTEKYELGYEW